jgi:hypothetical protein
MKKIFLKKAYSDNSLLSVDFRQPPRLYLHYAKVERG